MKSLNSENKEVETTKDLIPFGQIATLLEPDDEICVNTNLESPFELIGVAEGTVGKRHGEKRKGYLLFYKKRGNRKQVVINKELYSTLKDAFALLGNLD